jgi:16S rRNA (adenine1518-N6/adenine1519-N6)-dimethyltransferase
MMNLSNLKTIKEILEKYRTKPSHLMGQNFLVNAGVLANIIEASNISPDDVVVEVGPGIGTLTQALAQKAKKVIAIEKDKAMVEILKETMKEYNNVEIIHADILQPNSYTLDSRPYKVVANIPYYLTSALIRQFLEEKNQPESMILMIQKEVAQRICAKPPSMSILAAAVQIYAEPKIISYVSKNSFWPAPEVDSAIIKIIPHSSALSSAEFRNKFFRILKAGFSHPRKQLINNLSASLKKERGQTKEWLLKNSIQPTQRAETLTIEDWKDLANSL